MDNQRGVYFFMQQTSLFTALKNTFGAPQRLSAFGAHTFPNVITKSVVPDHNEKIKSIDSPWFKLVDRDYKFRWVRK
jgi:hypothetical protein